MYIFRFLSKRNNDLENELVSKFDFSKLKYKPVTL